MNGDKFQLSDDEEHTNDLHHSPTREKRTTSR